MEKRFPYMYDTPEKPNIFAGLFYCVLCFFTLPFLLSLLQFIDLQTPGLRFNYELIFHTINGLVAVLIFREYLADAFLAVQIDTRKVLTAAAVGLVCIVVWLLLAAAVFLLLRSKAGYLTLFYTLPVTELDVFAFSGELVQERPLFGTLCTVLLTPITTCCLFYATAFAPVGNRHPLLPYFTVALVLLFPRLCNAFNFSELYIELILYLVQLPIHWFACRAYQKADSVWAPVFALSAANLLACALIHLPSLI